MVPHRLTDSVIIILPKTIRIGEMENAGKFETFFEIAYLNSKGTSIETE